MWVFFALNVCVYSGKACILAYTNYQVWNQVNQNMFKNIVSNLGDYYCGHGATTECAIK